MSISRALGAEKPAAKRPRSYMEGRCGRKLSIMSTVLPNTPSQKSKEQMLSFLGGYVKQNKGAHHEHQQSLGAEKPATKRPRSCMEGPRGGKASCKKSKRMYMVAASPKKGGEGGRARARARPPPPLSGRVHSARAGFFLYIYLSISTYLSLSIYIYTIHISYVYIYIYIRLSLSLSLSLFKQVMLLERA